MDLLPLRVEDGYTSLVKQKFYIIPPQRKEENGSTSIKTLNLDMPLCFWVSFSLRQNHYTSSISQRSRRLTCPKRYPSQTRKNKWQALLICQQVWL